MESTWDDVILLSAIAFVATLCAVFVASIDLLGFEMVGSGVIGLCALAFWYLAYVAYEEKEDKR